MKVTARWPRPSRPVFVSAAVLAAAGLVVGSAGFLLLLVALAAAWLVAGLRVDVQGGGFRPLRTIDLIEFNAADQLDAYDQEQAMIRARS